MRADAKIYTLIKANGEIVSINASLKNLCERLVLRKKVPAKSIVCDRSSVLKALKTGDVIFKGVSTGTGKKKVTPQYTLSTWDLGDLKA